MDPGGLMGGTVTRDSDGYLGRERAAARVRMGTCPWGKCVLDFQWRLIPARRPQFLGIAGSGLESGQVHREDCHGQG